MVLKKLNDLAAAEKAGENYQYSLRVSLILSTVA